MNLNDTWKNCLEMWGWVSEQGDDVEESKREWLKAHGFDGDKISANCFFCQYNEERKELGCSNCPGKLVNENFDCQSDSYGYDTNPAKFYKKLVKLNKIRMSS